MKHKATAAVLAAFVVLAAGCGQEKKVTFELSTAVILKARAEALFGEVVRMITAVVIDQRPFNEREVDRLKEIRDEALSLAQRAEEAATIEDSTTATIGLLKILIGAFVE